MSQKIVRLRQRRHWIAGLASLATLLIASAAWFLLMPSPADGEPVRGITAVEVIDNAFTPPVIEVETGATVTWTFAGDEDHNVVGDGWGDEDPRVYGQLTHTFDTAGTYRYTCTLHGGMDGRVDVVAAGSSS